MKLLKLKIESSEGFRSLPEGFTINFHTLDDTEAMEKFRPFCFAGLNGSGKSNVLEALSAIFYHLEFCVARYKPNSFKNHFQRETSTPDAYLLEYLISEKGSSLIGVSNMVKVSIKKEIGAEPIMNIEQNTSWLEGKTRVEKVSMTPLVTTNLPAPAKQYLPDNVVAYSSGENETLSLPYIKCRLVHYDEYVHAIENGYKEYKEPENSLVYIDSNMSQAVLLTNLIFEEAKIVSDGEEKEGALSSFAEEIGVLGLQCFRMNINLTSIEKSKISNQVLDSYGRYFKKNIKGELVIVQLLEEKIKQLKYCATCFYENEEFLALDFFITPESKKAFKAHFTNSFELFQLFRLLYELNAYTVDEYVKEEVYQSKGFYTDWKLPQLIPKDNIFAFTDFFVLKKMPGSDVPKPLLLKEFSDGEHQFIHTMGICIMLKERRALLLLDEPETHFNPAWRAKFIKALNDSIAASAPIPIKLLSAKEVKLEVLPSPNNLDYYLQKDVLLTSHSPFIISDCLPDNVILFERDGEGLLTAKKASELGIDTYGTSVNLLTSRIFKNKETIGKYVFSKLNEFRQRFQTDENKEDIIEAINNEFGDSIEKLLLIKEFSGKEK
jgi:restriction system-associated AAA family ATPase